MNNLIWTKQNSLSGEFCSHLTSKFENDDRKEKGKTLSGLDSDAKISTDLFISSYSGWEEEDKVLYTALQTAVDEYDHYCRNINQRLGFRIYELNDTGYQIQRTCPGEYYNWHSDFYFESNAVRLLTFIWYLNDIQYDGETEFIDGTKIVPETGKIMIFPATWTYVHRGVTPKKEVKYICTGWIYSNRTDLKV